MKGKMIMKRIITALSLIAVVFSMASCARRGDVDHGDDGYINGEHRSNVTENYDYNTNRNGNGMNGNGYGSRSTMPKTNVDQIPSRIRHGIETMMPNEIK